EAKAKEDAALDDARALPCRGADRAEQHGVELADGLEVLVGEHRAVTLVALPPEVERHRVIRHAGRVEHLHGLAHDLGADAVSPDDADAIGHALPISSMPLQRKTARLRWPEVDGQTRTPVPAFATE